MVLRGKRNLRMYLVSPLPSQTHEPRPNTFFSGVLIKAKSTTQGFKKDNILIFRLAKKKKEERICYVRKLHISGFPRLKMAEKEHKKETSSLIHTGSNYRKYSET